MGHAELVADGARLRKDLALGRRRIKEEEERRKAERQDINRPLVRTLVLECAHCRDCYASC